MIFKVVLLEWTNCASFRWKASSSPARCEMGQAVPDH